ncbi:MAG: DNA mismatch repair protein MutS [Bacteroidales bacterium]|jgi:dsDNA-specific endonuclease/ATPase MutS2|nr:DNA mismatch repair protein MutS [Bacteroidales bacterium]
MNIKKAIEAHNGLKFIINNLSLSSSIGRQALMELKFIKDKSILERELEITSEIMNFLSIDYNYTRIKRIRSVLECINDISGSIKLLEKDGVLDDVSLFEIKSFSLLSEKLRDLLKVLDIPELKLPDLDKAIEILDPEKMKLYQFYIYSSYSEELREKRRLWEEAKAREESEEKILSIYVECLEIEEEIRKDLSSKLKVFIPDFILSLKIISKLDITLGKAQYFIDNKFSKPEISDSEFSFKALFYPPLEEILKTQNQEFQRIDFSLDNKPVLITGANMSGKTIILKSLSLSQFLFQFGFFIPCESSQLCIVEDILISIDDQQNEKKGLSSFAWEILNLNTFLQKAKQGKKYLILIDELARTTNPIEGVAIVDTYLEMISNTNSFSITTTHYSGIKTRCRRLRVKGIRKDIIKEEIEIKNIQNLIDYSLIEDNSDQAPNDALNIAEIIGVDKDFIYKARNYILNKEE